MGIVTNNHMQSCIDACNKCAQACLECFNACLNEPDLNARKNCVKMLVECAMMCQMSAATMSMGGSFTTEHCQMCAKVCDKCAEECIGLFIKISAISKTVFNNYLSNTVFIFYNLILQLIL